MTVPNPSAHVEALRRLIETWRGYAKSDRERMDASETSVGVSFLQGSQSSYEICADGLEAALAPLSGPVDASGEPEALMMRDAAEFALRAVADTLLTVLLELPNRYGDNHTIDRRIAIAAAQKMKGDAIRAVDAAILNGAAAAVPSSPAQKEKS